MAYAPGSAEQQLEKDLYDGMVEHAATHIAQSSGSLVKLEYDPEQYEAQRLHTFCVEPEELVPLDWVDNIGRLVMDNYYDISAGVRDSKSQQGAWLRESGERMSAGESSLVATTHKNLIDPGVVLGTLANALRYEGFVFETGTTFFRMLSVLGYKFKPGMPEAPCLDVVKAFSNKTYQVITRTRSTRESGLLQRNEAMPAFAEGNNRRVKHSTDAFLGQGRAMLAQAYNASVWKWNAAGTECVAERITPGTAETMAHPNVHILEVNFDIVEREGCKEGYLEICGPPRKLSTPEEAHDVAEHMIEGFNNYSESRGEGRPYVYETAEQAEAVRQAQLLER